MWQWCFYMVFSPESCSPILGLIVSLFTFRQVVTFWPVVHQVVQITLQFSMHCKNWREKVDWQPTTEVFLYTFFKVWTCWESTFLFWIYYLVSSLEYWFHLSLNCFPKFGPSHWKRYSWISCANVAITALWNGKKVLCYTPTSVIQYWRSWHSSKVPGSILGLTHGWVSVRSSLLPNSTQLCILPRSVKWITALHGCIKAADRGTYTVQYMLSVHWG